MPNPDHSGEPSRASDPVLAQRELEAAGIFNVASHGATGDGRTLDTTAIQAAIDACHSSGGGVVRLPAGRFLSGAIVLKSHVALHFSPGAVLLASPNQDDYPAGPDGGPVKHLIYARDAERIGLEGTGTIDGHSDAFFEPDPTNPSGQKLIEWRPSPLIELVNCCEVSVTGVTIRRAPGWTLRPKNCDGVKIRGISLLNDLCAYNSDGIDVDSSRNVMISDCHIVAGDDAIVLKTSDKGGGTVGVTENVTVTNCVLVSSCCALKLGSESHGDFRHCVFSNCVIRGSRTGIALMGKDGGAMEAIRFHNITIATAPKFGKVTESPNSLEWPISIESDRRTQESGRSQLRDVSLSDVTVYTRGRIIAQGQPGAEVDGLTFRNLTVRIKGFQPVEGMAKLSIGGRVNQDTDLSNGDKPAAFILAYARDVVLDGVTVVWPEDPSAPARHALYAEELDGADLRGLRGGASVEGFPPMLLERCREVLR